MWFSRLCKFDRNRKPQVETRQDAFSTFRPRLCPAVVSVRAQLTIHATTVPKRKISGNQERAIRFADAGTAAWSEAGAAVPGAAKRLLHSFP